MLRVSIYVVYGWMAVISMIVLMFSFLGIIHQDKFTFGPNDDFLLFNTPINTWGKYWFVVCCGMINTIVRTLNQMVQKPWLYNTLQNPNAEMTYEVREYANWVNNADSLYNWIDWFLYLNILTSQYDMVVIELFISFIASSVVTRYFVKIKEETFYHSHSLLHNTIQRSGNRFETLENEC